MVFKIQGKYSDVNAWVLEGTPDLPEGIKAYSRSTIIERSWYSQLERYPPVL
ncbi:MAG: hypothetical protein IPO25_21285 [Saprospiraceae bacterium]|nr:hypothetical protein [Saprospiraceae bacterium]